MPVPEPHFSIPEKSTTQSFCGIGHHCKIRACQKSNPSPPEISACSATHSSFHLDVAFMSHDALAIKLRKRRFRRRWHHPRTVGTPPNFTCVVQECLFLPWIRAEPEKRHVRGNKSHRRVEMHWAVWSHGWASLRFRHSRQRHFALCFPKAASHTHGLSTFPAFPQPCFTARKEFKSKVLITTCCDESCGNVDRLLWHGFCNTAYLGIST